MQGQRRHLVLQEDLLLPRHVQERPDHAVRQPHQSVQITQYDNPIGEGGVYYLGDKPIGITRIHVEEDPGKTKRTGDLSSLVDYNRSGIPLAEIVTEPDMKTPAEAREFLKSLIEDIRTVLDIPGDGERSIRCDCNISVGKERVEVKNVTGLGPVLRGHPPDEDPQGRREDRQGDPQVRRGARRDHQRQEEGVRGRLRVHRRARPGHLPHKGAGRIHQDQREPPEDDRQDRQPVRHRPEDGQAAGEHLRQTGRTLRIGSRETRDPERGQVGLGTRELQLEVPGGQWRRRRRRHGHHRQIRRRGDQA